MSANEPEDVAMSIPADSTGDINTPRKKAKTVDIHRSIIDNDGDLVLRVGEECTSPTMEFLVCSSTMRRASPVWKKMLFGGFQESKPAEGDWVVALPDDKPDVLTTLLNVVHANFRETYRPLDVAGIYEHVVLMDKYDIIRFIQPWRDAWMDKVKEVANADEADILCMAAYIALQMGAESQAYSILCAISKFITVDEKNNLVPLEAKLLDSLDTIGRYSVSGAMHPLDPLSSRVSTRLIDTGILREMREARIQGMLESAKTAIDWAMQRGSYLRDPYGNDRDVHHDFLGRFWHAVTTVRGGMLPLSAGEISETPNDLKASLGQVIGTMSPKASARSSAGDSSAMFQLKRALEDLDEGSLRRCWGIDPTVMNGRRKMSGAARGF